jgi:hypothetical protein
MREATNAASFGFGIRPPGGGSGVRAPYLTPTVVVPRWPSKVAVIVASPSSPAVATPDDETLTTPELLDCQEAALLRSSTKPFEFVTRAVSC